LSNNCFGLCLCNYLRGFGFSDLCFHDGSYLCFHDGSYLCFHDGSYLLLLRWLFSFSTFFNEWS
jgi:hypothetical protein